MSVAEILRRAKARIEDEAHHCRYAMAQDEGGEPLDCGDDPEAVAWCAVGALAAEGCDVPLSTEEPLVGADPAYLFLHAAAKEMWGRRPEDVNDVWGHAAALRMYGRAVELAVAAGA